MSWLSGFSATRRPNRAALRAHRRLVGQVAERKAAEIELVAGGGEQEPALVALRVGGAMQLGAVRAIDAADVVAGGERFCAQIARHAEQIGELRPWLQRMQGTGVSPAA